MIELHRQYGDGKILVNASRIDYAEDHLVVVGGAEIHVRETYEEIARMIEMIWGVI